MNNFPLIRLFAASLVIFSHAYGFCGKADPIYLFTGSLTGGILAVYIFFTISGYLISESWFRKPELKAFFVKRILRIFPALIVVVILSAFVFGPFMSELQLNEYFKDKTVYTYLINLSLWKLQFHLPGVLIEGRAVVFNAPLWTLFFEFAMYITVPVFALLGLLNKVRSQKSGVRGQMWILWLIFILFYLITLWDIPTNLFILKINVFYFVRFFLYFYAGVLYHYYAKDKKMNIIFLILSLTGFVLTRETPLFGLFTMLSVLTFVFWFAYIKWRPLQFIVKSGDYSYGLYLYGYIVQIYLQNNLGCTLPLIYKIPISLGLTFVFAFMSWHLVESKARNIVSSIKYQVSSIGIK